MTGDRFRIRSHRHEPERLYRLGLAVQLQRLDRIDLDRIPEQPPRQRPDQDLAVGGRLLQPGGNIDRIAGGERRPRPEITGHHLACVDADPHTDPNAALALQLVVQPFQRLPHLRCCLDRPQRVVLVHHRHPEHRHHRIPDELLHQPAMPLQHRPHLRVVAAQHMPQRLRIQPLPQRGRTGHVAEDRGHRLAQLVPRGHRPQRRTTTPAEPILHIHAHPTARTQQRLRRQTYGHDRPDSLRAGPSSLHPTHDTDISKPADPACQDLPNAAPRPRTDDTHHRKRTASSQRCRTHTAQVPGTEFAGGDAAARAEHVRRATIPTMSAEGGLRG